MAANNIITFKKGDMATLNRVWHPYKEGAVVFLQNDPTSDGVVAVDEEPISLRRPDQQVYINVEMLTKS